MGRLIKNENSAIGAYETAGRERVSIAAQLSDWGESTEDEAVSDISDKLGVLMAEMGEQEDIYAQNLEDYRGLLKQIRNTESSVQPSRDNRAKVADEIQRLKWKEPTSPKLATLEQELVRAEAQNLVAEAQLTNVTRQKLKEAFDVHLAAVIERGEKQVLLARHARRLLNYLDDTPVVPGDTRQAYEFAPHAKQVLEDAETDLRSWQTTVEPIQTSAEPSAAMLPSSAAKAQRAHTPPTAEPEHEHEHEHEHEAYDNESTREAEEADGVARVEEEIKAKRLEQPTGSGPQPVAVPY